MIYPIIREDKKSGLFLEYTTDYNPIVHEYESPTQNNAYNVYEHVEYAPATLPTHKFDRYEQLELKPLIRKELSSITKEKFEPNHITRYFILDDKTYVDVRVLSNINGDLELFCMGYKEVYGEPRQFYREKVVMTTTYYDKYIESVLKRFALKAIHL